MTRRSKGVFIAGAITLVLAASGLWVAAKCAHARRLSAVVAADVQLQAVFSRKDAPLAFRKEALLPSSCGKELGENEDFVEVWSDHRKLGWIYLVSEKGFIRSTGYQLIDKAFAPLAGQKVDVKSIDASGIKTHLIDGREFK